MNRASIDALLSSVADGDTSVAEALKAFENIAFSDMGFATVDHHRALRQGLPEVIFGEGKTPEQVVQIACALADREQNVLVTRCTPEAAVALADRLPNTVYHHQARVAALRLQTQDTIGSVGILTAGTADIPVAEEAAVCAEMMNLRVTRIFDVGVAGLHRLLAQGETLRALQVLIVVAGMEGALPSVVGGLVPQPVIAVPTSIGYGAHLQGVTTLFAMLSSCAAGVTVVNIDNGFGAAAAAHHILRQHREDP